MPLVLSRLVGKEGIFFFGACQNQLPGPRYNPVIVHHVSTFHAVSSHAIDT